jgi:hypothetical protein
MAKRYTVDYMAQYTAAVHGDEDSCDFYTELFEADCAEQLVGCRAEDVGGVVLYYKLGEEAAFFDYENLVGSVYALGGTRADYMPE